jgi:hypothetical protein
VPSADGNISIGRSSYASTSQLSKVLGSNSSSVLAAKASTDADAGYPSGLRLNAALDDNDSGRFTLASGLTIAGNAASVASSTTDQIQSLLNSVQGYVSTLSSTAYSDDEKNRNRVLLKESVDKIRDLIKDARVGSVNLLDSSQSSGIKLNITSGALSNVGTLQQQTVGGTDKNYAYQSDELNFKTIDLSKAADDLQQLEVGHFPGTAANVSGNTGNDTIVRFQGLLNQSRDNLKAYQGKLQETAKNNLTISSDPGSTTVKDGFEARQLASRLAHDLNNQSFNITANPALKYFSLFS